MRVRVRHLRGDLVIESGGSGMPGGPVILDYHRSDPKVLNAC